LHLICLFCIVSGFLLLALGQVGADEYFEGSLQPHRVDKLCKAMPGLVHDAEARYCHFNRLLVDLGKDLAGALALLACILVSIPGKQLVEKKLEGMRLLVNCSVVDRSLTD